MNDDELYYDLRTFCAELGWTYVGDPVDWLRRRVDIMRAATDAAERDRHERIRLHMEEVVLARRERDQRHEAQLKAEADLAATRTALAQAEQQNSHEQCHDLVCNGSRKHPRGTKGVTCSCRGRDTAYGELEAERAAHARTREALKHLSAKWRERAAKRAAGSKGTVVENMLAFGVGALRDCADELDAALAAPPEGKDA